jgi:hypothetical protein
MMILQQIKIFLFVLSVVFTLRYVFEFVFKLFVAESTPMKLSKIEGVFLYFAVSFIITFFLI